MRVSSYNPQNRYRKRSSERFFAFMFVILILGLSFVFGFWTGGQNAGQQERALKKRVDTLLDEREALQDLVTKLQAEGLCACERRNDSLIVKRTVAGNDRIAYLIMLSHRYEKDVFGTHGSKEAFQLIEGLKKIIGFAVT